MKKYFVAVFTIVLLVTLGCADNTAKNNPSSTDVTWVENLEEGIKIAKDENKNILVNFTGSDWCIWCKRLSGEVFTQKTFKEYAKENLVLVKLDFPKSNPLPQEQQMYNNNLARQFGVQGFPTIILLDDEGKFVGKTGYQRGGPEQYIKHINQYFAAGS